MESGTRVAKGTLLNVIGQGAPILVGVLTIPYIIRRLGPEAFGLLSMMWAALGYFGVFDIGLARSTTRLVAEALGRNEPSAIPKIVRTSTALHLAAGIVGGVLVAITVPWIIGGIFRVPPALAADARMGFYLLAAAVPIVVTSAAYRGILEGYRRFALVNAVRIISGAGTFALPAAALAVGAGFLGVVLLLVVIRLATGVVYAGMCRRVLGPFGGKERFDRTTAIALFAFGRWIMVSNVVAPILIYLDRGIIGAFVSLSAVAYYSAPYEILARLWILPSSIALALFPTISLIGYTDADRLQFLYRRSIKMILTGVGPIVVLLVAFADPILDTWLGPEFARESSRVMQVLALGVLVSSLAHVPGSLLQGLGRPDLPAKFQAVQVPIYALGAWALTITAGITGTAIAWSLKVMLDAGLLFAAAALLIPRPLHPAVASPLRPSIMLLCAYAVALALVRFLSGPGGVQWILVILATAGFGWLAWARVLDARDREALRAALLVGRAERPQV